MRSPRLVPPASKPGSRPQRIHGFAPQQALGRGIDALCCEDEMSITLTQLLEQAARPREWDGELLQRNASGATFPAPLLLSARRGDDGAGFAPVARAIDERGRDLGMLRPDGAQAIVEKRAEAGMAPLLSALRKHVAPMAPTPAPAAGVRGARKRPARTTRRTR